MNQNKFGEIVYSGDDLVHLLMSGYDISKIPNFTVDNSVDTQTLLSLNSDLYTFDTVPTWNKPTNEDTSLSDYDSQNQKTWFMPKEYLELDIAEYVLSLCKTDHELQRVGDELLLFYDRNLFDLLRYLKFLVDTMRANNIVWGVGRGSSVSSYILYLLGVHRVDSLYYQLDPKEFLR